MTHPNEDLARGASAAFGRGDLGTLQNQFFAQDIRWHVSGRGALAGDYEGVAAVMQLLGRIVELSGGTARFELHDVLANDAHTVSLATIRAERAGKKYQDNIVQVIHVKNGKAAEVWTHSADPSAAEEFWS
jgi:ketosteroid isomerase-like protein